MRIAARLALSAAIAALLLWLLAAWGDVSLDDLTGAWRRLSPSVYLIGLAVHASIYVVRSQRFRVLLPREHRPNPAVMLAVSAAHNLAAYVLPAKTGELTLVMYLKATSGVPAHSGFAALVVSRLLDLATLSFSVACAALWLALMRSDAAPAWLVPCALVLLALAVVLMVLSARSDLLVRLFERVASALHLGRSETGRKLLLRMRDVATALREAGSGSSLWIATALSLVMWILIFVFYGVLARGFGLPPEMGVADAAFGSGLAQLTNLLPINGLAGFGTQEAGWVVGFGLLGVPKDLAMSTGLGVHLVQILNTCAFGLAGHFAMGVLGARSGATGEPPVG